MKGHMAMFMGILLTAGLAGVFLPAQATDPAGLFPELAGWLKKGAVESFVPENLYEYIDGAAENFLNYDFRQLAVQGYGKGQKSLSAEIYFHGTPENAFGIYSSEKPLAGNYLAIGGQAYAEEGVLNFVSAAYYVKLNAFGLGAEDGDVLPTLAQQIARAIGGKNGLPQILQAFPLEGKRANSERFILNNFLGHDFLRAAYAADYLVNGQSFQLFVISAGSKDKAHAMLEKYAALDKVKPGQGIQPGELMINDPYNGPIRLLWQDEFICGSGGQAPAAAEYIASLARKLAGQ